MIIVELGFSQKFVTSPDSMVDLMFPFNMMNMVISWVQEVQYGITYNGTTMSNHVYQSNPLEWRKIYWWMAGWWNNWIIAYMIDSKWPTHTPQMMDETIMVMENDVAET
jgi:hypothetical protein